ncbi:MAG: hypothetical protein Rubg2KO_15640 [Rubricoccaceae bacterium]
MAWNATEVSADGPVRHFDFDQSSGATVPDLTGNEDGTVTGTESTHYFWNTLGKALVLFTSGTNGTVALTPVSSDTIAVSLEVGLVALPTGTELIQIVDTGSSFKGWVLAVDANGAVIAYSANDNNLLKSADGAVGTSMTHIISACYEDGGDHYLLVDGVEVARNTGVTAGVGGSAGGLIGGSASTDAELPSGYTAYVNGTIAFTQFAWYQSAVSSARLALHAGVGGATTITAQGAAAVAVADVATVSAGGGGGGGNPDPTDGLTLTRTYAVGATSSISSGTERQADMVLKLPNVTFPASPAAGVLIEFGGGGTGFVVGVDDTASWFRVRAGDGGVAGAPPSSQIDVDVSHIDVPVGLMPFDGAAHDIVVEFNTTTNVLRLWADNDLVGTSDAPPAGGDGYTGSFASWTGSGTGGYLRAHENVDPNIPATLWPGGTAGAGPAEFYSGQLSTWTPGVGSTEITAQGAATAPVADGATISQTHQVVAQGAVSAPVSDPASIVQEHQVTAQGAATLPVADEGSVSADQTVTITAQGAATSAVADSGSIAQTHEIVGQGAVSSPVSDAATLSQAHEIVGQGATTNPVTDAASVTQDHQIAAQGAATSPVADEGTISAENSVTITAQGVSTSPVADEGSLSQVHQVMAQGAVGAPVADAGTITQEHQMSAQGGATEPVADEATLAGEHVIDAQGAATAPVADEASVTQEHRVTALGGVTLPVAGSGSIAQVHVIEAQGAATTPLADEASLAEAPALVRLSIQRGYTVSLSVVRYSGALEVRQLYRAEVGLGPRYTALLSIQ